MLTTASNLDASKLTGLVPLTSLSAKVLKADNSNTSLGGDFVSVYNGTIQMLNVGGSSVRWILNEDGLRLTNGAVVDVKNSAIVAKTPDDAFTKMSLGESGLLLTRGAALTFRKTDDTLSAVLDNTEFALRNGFGIKLYNGGDITGTSGSNITGFSNLSIGAVSIIAGINFSPDPENVPPTATISSDSGFLIISGGDKLRSMEHIYAGITSAKRNVYCETAVQGGWDVAEVVPNPLSDLEPGDVCVIDTDSIESVMRHTGVQYDRHVAGVVSTSPGSLLGGRWEDEDESENQGAPIALAGRVPTKVTTKYVNSASEEVRRPIQRGFLLVSSSIPGHAMAADPSDFENGVIPPGTIIGKAMQDWNPDEGYAQEGVIKVWVNLA